MTATFPKRRRAKFRLDPATLWHLLGLPEGMGVVALDAANDPLGVVVIVESPDLPEVEHNVEAPFVHLMFEKIEIDGERPLLRVAEIGVPQ